MGSDVSKSGGPRKRSGIANVFAGGDCEHTSGDTKSARGATIDSDDGVDTSGSVVRRAIPTTPQHCTPSRVKAPVLDATSATLANVEYMATVRLLADKKKKRAPSTKPPSSPPPPRTSAPAATRAGAHTVPTSMASIAWEVVPLPAYRTTGLIMASNAQTQRALAQEQAQRGTSAPASTSASQRTRAKDTMDEGNSSATAGLTMTSLSATESPRVVCDELLDEASTNVAEPVTAAANSATTTTTASETRAASPPPICTEAVVGAGYFEALRLSWSATPAKGSDTAKYVANLPSLATSDEVGTPVEILHMINHQGGTFPLFKKPIPLDCMIQMLKPRWEDEGLYEQVEEQERYAQIEAARRAKHRR